VILNVVKLRIFNIAFNLYLISAHLPLLLAFCKLTAIGKY